MNFDNLRNSKKDKILKNNYKRWKLEALDECGYFIIFQGFLENNLLRDISGNALRLYLYLGINSNNIHGVVWHSNEKIAKYFGKSDRTIRLWMHELEKLNLIKRMRLKYNGNVYTYLQPYNYKINCKDEIPVREFIEGELYIDEINSLYIRGNNICIPVTSNLYIELWDSYEEEWVPGKIETRRICKDLFSGEEEIKYIFKTYDGRQQSIEDRTLKIRGLIL